MNKQKNLVLIIAIIVILVIGGYFAYTYLEKENKIDVNKTVINNTTNTQVANPASVNCVEKGGKLSIVDNPEGQVGMCTLSDGTVCEEWAYFRGECQKK